MEKRAAYVLSEKLGNPVAWEKIMLNDKAAQNILDLLKKDVFPVPSLNEPGRVEMTRTQAAEILAHSLFYPVDNLNWTRLLNSDSIEAAERLTCLVHYFETYVPSEEIISFERIKQEEGTVIDEDAVIDGRNVWLHKKNVEDTSVSLCKAIVDFANERIHIHSIIPSLTQEEVLFSIHSECFIVLAMVTNEMAADEVILMNNVRMHTKYVGYSETFRALGSIKLHVAHNIIAMDACMHDQYYQAERDIRKAQLGFSRFRVVSTGRWGCGIFGGDPVLKFLEQVIAGRNLKMLLYSDSVVFGHLRDILQLLGECKPTVGWLMYHMTHPMGADFYKHMKNQLELKLLE